ncbi:energy-coupling factor transport system substrate-specific component [Natranaerovirga hydrolytica]|uniref:Energy-coupling factor transport system substrate-specific component n=1 Tax=Natranaerovirga hydrolytica TaxID=680378 RepID=A0A4R1MZL5_9FIRM|nr:MptD family putative ECF transporter S component [Natranaerovirga hydrolytica]TCK98726.1 energy-coupling factor transport system substrate-specific component [Natranaerovirga hydrolytica]
MDTQLNVQDLISVGIFTAFYYLVFFIAAMFGFIPILFVLMPLYLPIIAGIPFMLFLTKVKKFWMVTIMSIIVGTLFFATGHTWISLVVAVVCGLFADTIFKAGQYKSFGHSVIGYCVFSLWLLGGMLPLWIMRDSYFTYIRDMMGDEYTNAIISMTPTWMLLIMIIMCVIGSIIGAYLGKSVLKKHFKRAGIL